MSTTGHWRRRSRAVSGHVAFPTQDPAWDFVPEGGMFVRLAVEPKEDDDFLVCAGGWNLVLYDEEFVGDDTDIPCAHCEKPLAEDMTTWRCRREARTFPRLNSGDDYPLQTAVRNCSILYLAVMTIGSTGWEGMHKETGKMFLCRYEHLTESGQALYAAVQAAYPGRRLVLQTWLDT